MGERTATPERSKVRLPLALAALLGLLALCVAVAQADPPPASLPSPPLPDAGQPGLLEALQTDSPPADTDPTPQAKQSDLWQQVAGAKFGEQAPIVGSATSFDDSLYAVAFLNTKQGFAGGSELIDCPAGKVGVPVLYRFTDTAAYGPAWALS